MRAETRLETILAGLAFVSTLAAIWLLLALLSV